MNRVFTLLFFFSMLSFQVQMNGQCTADGTVTTWGLHPAPSIDLEGLGPVPEIPACIGEDYSYTFSVVVPSSFSVAAGTFGVTKATVTAVSGLPDGMSFGECNQSGCEMAGGTTGCFRIIGTPDASNAIGNYALQITINYEGTIGGLPTPPIDLNFPPLSSSFNPLSVPLDPYVIELREAGQCVNNVGDLAEELSLEGNNPNPFSETTVINVNAEKSGSYDLEVYNLLGEKVSSATYDFVSGENRIEFDGSALSSGIYVYTLGNKTGRVSRRMVIH